MSRLDFHDSPLDVCIWTRNSEEYLPATLARFDEVIPKSAIGRKIAVDGNSTDRTVSILQRFGWRVFAEPSPGIATAFNEALRHVRTEFFVSIEHDVLLAKDWFEKIYPHVVRDKRCLVAHGVLKPTDPFLRAILPLQDLRRYVCISNNIYRTEAIKALGGLPTICPICGDTWMKRKIEGLGLKWVIDPSIVSWHIRPGVRNEAKHVGVVYRRCVCRRYDFSTRYLTLLLARSPAGGLKLAYKTRVAKAPVVYPYWRLKMLQYWLDGTIKRAPDLFGK